MENSKICPTHAKKRAYGGGAIHLERAAHEHADSTSSRLGRGTLTGQNRSWGLGGSLGAFFMISSKWESLKDLYTYSYSESLSKLKCSLSKSQNVLVCFLSSGLVKCVASIYDLRRLPYRRTIKQQSFKHLFPKRWEIRTGTNTFESTRRKYASSNFGVVLIHFRHGF